MASRRHPNPLSGGDRKALGKELGRAREGRDADQVGRGCCAKAERPIVADTESPLIRRQPDARQREWSGGSS